MTEIKDIDILKNVDILIHNEIIIWGAGEEGKDIARLLIEATIPIECFTDTNEEMWGKDCMGSTIVAPSEICEMVKRYHTIIIIGSLQYAESIREDMERLQIQPSGGIFSWYGVQCAIELNIYNKVFTSTFRLSFLNNKRLIRESYNMKTEMGWYTELWVDSQFSEVNPILFLTPTKVGHRTIGFSLRKRGIPVWGRHELLEIPDIVLKGFWKYDQMPHKIITSVREPIQRDISAYMESFYPSWVNLKEEVNFDLKQNVTNYLKHNAKTKYGYLFDYYDIFYDITGIDIYKYPFDREQGYGIIREKNWEILLLKLEKLNDNVSVIADFLNIPDFHLYTENVGAEKWYKYLYKNLKADIEIPQEVIDKYYIGNERMDYFYTDSEKATFLNKF